MAPTVQQDTVRRDEKKERPLINSDNIALIIGFITTVTGFVLIALASLWFGQFSEFAGFINHMFELIVKDIIGGAASTLFHTSVDGFKFAMINLGSFALVVGTPGLVVVAIASLWIGQFSEFTGFIKGCFELITGLIKECFELIVKDAIGGAASTIFQTAVETVQNLYAVISLEKIILFFAVAVVVDQFPSIMQILTVNLLPNPPQD